MGYYLDNRRTAVLLTEKQNAAGERDLQWASWIRSICEEKQKDNSSRHSMEFKRDAYIDD